MEYIVQLNKIIMYQDVARGLLFIPTSRLILDIVHHIKMVNKCLDIRYYVIDLTSLYYNEVRFVSKYVILHNLSWTNFGIIIIISIFVYSNRFIHQLFHILIINGSKTSITYICMINPAFTNNKIRIFPSGIWFN